MNTIISILLIVISIATFYFYIDPMYTGVEGKKEGIKQLLENKQKINIKNNKIREIQKKKKELKDEYIKLRASNENALDRLEKMIPNNMENARLINYIHTIKTGSMSTRMSDIRISTGLDNKANKKGGKIVISEKKDYKSVNLAFSFSSDYKNFKKFLDDLYKSLRIVDVVSVSFKPEMSKSQGENLLLKDKFTFNIVIRTYWLNNK